MSAPWLPSRLNYLLTKGVHAAQVTIKNIENGIIRKEAAVDSWVEVFKQTMTRKFIYEGSEMLPTLDAKVPQTLVVRKIPEASTSTVFVGDVVVVNNPDIPEQELVRRVAAMVGEEMESSVPEEEPFRIEPRHCWVLCDNTSVKPKDAVDSRFFGPLPLDNIIGRAMYVLKSTTDHGRITNSAEAMEQDTVVLAHELASYVQSAREEEK